MATDVRCSGCGTVHKDGPGLATDASALVTTRSDAAVGGRERAEHMEGGADATAPIRLEWRNLTDGISLDQWKQNLRRVMCSMDALYSA
jgi:hypothetical protein